MNILKQLQNHAPQSSMTSGGINMFSMMEKFQSFQKSMAGRDPKLLLEQMVQSGKVTPEQVSQARKMAEQFSSILK